MRTKDFEKLWKGDFIIHKHYGLCIVESRNEIGIIIRPLSVTGIMRLRHESGCLFNRLLEHSIRCVKQKVDKPVIPKLVLKQAENCFELHEWDELGEISDTGITSTRLIKSFSDIEEVQKYLNDGENNN